MANYENKLVFPAVLKIMGLAGKNKAALHPNLPELFNLIHKKEQKIYQYLEQLNSSLDYEDQSPALAHIRNKLRTISDKFKESKMEWHHHIEESVMSCSCFNQYLNHSAFVERC